MDGDASEQRFPGVVEAVAVEVDGDAAADAARQDFVEIVAGRLGAADEGDIEDRIGRKQRPAGRADAVHSVEIFLRLDLLDGVDAGGQAGELVAPVGVGDRRADPLALLVAELDRHAFDGKIAGRERAVPVGVGDHAAGDRTGQNLAKVVVLAGLPALEPDSRNRIAGVLRGSAGGARRVQAVEIALRGDLHDLPIAGDEIDRHPGAVGGRGHGDRLGRRPIGQNADHADGRPGDPHFPRVADAVVVGVVVHVAAEPRRRRLGEIVVEAVFAPEERDAGDRLRVEHRAARRAIDRAGRRADAEVAVRLRFDDAVGSGQERIETVVAVGVGGGSHARVGILPFDELVKAQLHAGDARLARVLPVVQVDVFEHGTADRDRQRRLLQADEGPRRQVGPRLLAGWHVAVRREGQA
jgi:hypothetical protein